MRQHPPRITAAWLAHPATQAVFAALATAGFEGRVVGGAVRNALIGKAVADVDIATPARPEQVMAAAQAAGLDVVPTGLQHGTVTVMSQRIPHEITTLRRDVETDGRHAVVAFTDDWAADAGRRDFTINALYCGADGAVFDPLDGYGDLVARRVRFIGDAHGRIREDYLRILRFFRFTAEYADDAIDVPGLAAASELRDGLCQLSAERIRVEVLKILAARRAHEMVATMHDHGFWVQLLGLAPAPRHAQRLIEIAPKSDALARLFALAVVTPEQARDLGLRLRLSNAETDRLVTWSDLLARTGPDMSDRLLRRCIYDYDGDTVCAAIAIAQARRGADAGWRRLRHIADTWHCPTFPVRGRDLLELGIPAGPDVGARLRELEAWWIAHDFQPTRDALLARAVAPPQSERN